MALFLPHPPFHRFEGYTNPMLRGTRSALFLLLKAFLLLPGVEDRLQPLPCERAALQSQKHPWSMGWPARLWERKRTPPTHVKRTTENEGLLSRLRNRGNACHRPSELLDLTLKTYTFLGMVKTRRAGFVGLDDSPCSQCPKPRPLPKVC